MNLNYRISSFRAVMKPIYFIISFIVGSTLGILGFLLVVKNNLIDTSYRAYIVTSGSMEPAIKTGSIIITKAKPYYKIGDIVTFKNNSNIVTHRIVDMNLETITTQGDANDSPDLSTTPRENIIGGSFLAVPYAGWVIDFAKTPRGFVAMVVIPASIIIYEELKNLAREIKRLLGKIKISRKTNFSPLGAFLMFFGVLLLGGAGLRLVGVTQSNYLDREDYVGNRFQAADEFEQNISPSPTASPNPAPAPQSIVINEFYAYSSNDWVELYNPNAETIDISGWTLVDSTSLIFTFPENSLIPGSGFVVAEVGNRLNVGGDTITLSDNNESLVDEVSYDATAEGISEGRSPDGDAWIICQTASKNASNEGICQP